MLKNKTILLIFLVIFLSLTSYTLIKKIKKRTQPLNLIIISVDTLRADHMGIYGYKKNTTPNIDAWAKNAMIFTNLRTQVPSTYPSFAILMTGRGAFSSKIFDNSVFYTGTSPNLIPINDRTPTLAEILKKQGYYTAAFLNSPSLDASLTHINRGFDVFQNYLNEESRSGPSSGEKYKSYRNVIEGINWLGKNKDKKTFLWIHLMEPHAPYYPMDQFKCAFDKNYCDVINSKGIFQLENERNSLKECQWNGLPNNKVRLFETLYDGTVASTDKLVGLIFRRITNLGLDKNTVVVFYGDHGEGFDHNYYFMHSHELYDSHVKIPLIIKAPGEKRKENTDFLQNTDIFFTINKLLKPHAPDDLESLFNKNMFKWFSSILKKEQYLYYINTDLSKFAIQEKKYKYIYSIKNFSCLYKNQTEELYDLEKDPGELNNIILKNQELTRRLKTKLLDHLKKNNLPTTTDEKQKIKKINKDKQKALEQLKSLGY